MRLRRRSNEKKKKTSQRRINDVISDAISINSTAACEAAGCGRLPLGILQFPSSLRRWFYPRGSTPVRGRWICALCPLPGVLALLPFGSHPMLATPATIADGRIIWSRLHLRCMHLKQIRMLKMMCWLTVLCKITAAQLCSSLRWIVRTCHAWSFQWDQWAFYPLKCSFRGQFSAGKWYCQARIVHLSVLIVFPVMFI